MFSSTATSARPTATPDPLIVWHNTLRDFFFFAGRRWKKRAHKPGGNGGSIRVGRQAAEAFYACTGLAALQEKSVVRVGSDRRALALRSAYLLVSARDSVTPYGAPGSLGSCCTMKFPGRPLDRASTLPSRSKDEHRTRYRRCKEKLFERVA